jgi:hypothetical protein
MPLERWLRGIFKNFFLNIFCNTYFVSLELRLKDEGGNYIRSEFSFRAVKWCAKEAITTDVKIKSVLMYCKTVENGKPEDIRDVRITLLTKL